MKILLLGSTGMVGTALEHVCRKKNIECIGLSHDDVEITNPGELKAAVEKHKPGVVVNAIAIVGINPCELKPELAFSVHATAVSNMARLCESHKITLVQCSTHAVFDGTKGDYYVESDMPNPTSVYSATKYISERFAANLCGKHYVVRFPTLFGSRRNNALGFADKILKRLEEGEWLRIADDKIDSPTYTVDAAGAVISLLEKNMPFGIYHIANAGRVSYYDFALELIKMLRIDAKISRAKDSDFAAMAYKPLKTALRSEKLEPLRKWQEALREYMESINVTAAPARGKL